MRTEYPARDLSILDLLPQGVSKGAALKKLAAHLGVDREEVMAIGDNWNDVEMLEWAGQGVLMGNAAVELRAMAECARLGAGSAERPGRRGRCAGSRGGQTRSGRSWIELSERSMRGSLLITAGMMATLVAMAPSAQAAERIRLRNGFEMHCDHHAEVEGRTRLYLSAGEDSYIEFRPEEIAADRDDARSAGDKATEIRRRIRPDQSPQRHGNRWGTERQLASRAKLSEADLGEMLTRAGHAHNLDVDLLASLVKAESNGNAHAVSRAGAAGADATDARDGQGHGRHR